MISTRRSNPWGRIPTKEIAKPQELSPKLTGAKRNLTSISPRANPHIAHIPLRRDINRAALPPGIYPPRTLKNAAPRANPLPE